MEVSNEIKEDIRKTQSDLKHAIRVHQVWVTRLQEDENNVHLKSKVKEAEKEIITIGHAQKLVVDRLRRELELYQQRLKARNKQINIDNDNRYVAQQLRDHQLQCRRTNNISLLKPSVLDEIHIKTENLEDQKEKLSDSDNELKLNDKENSNHSDDSRYRNFSQLQNVIHESRNSFTNALSNVTAVYIGCEEGEAGSDREWSPPLAAPLTQDLFMRLLGLISPAQKEIEEKKRIERRKRATSNANKNDFLFGNYDMLPKRKKYNQFPYLQTPNEPPQTRSAKLRKQQNVNKSSREASPSGSSGEAKGSGPAARRAPPDVCRVCGRDDVPSLLGACACGCVAHSACWGSPRCACGRALPAPRARPPEPARYADKLAERRRLQEKNVSLCVELRKLEARAGALQASLASQHADKRRLLADHVRTQRNLQRLLDFVAQFKDDARSPPDSGSERDRPDDTDD